MMNRGSMAWAAVAAWICLSAVAGCGGSGESFAPEGGRGEGNVPIGRVKKSVDWAFDFALTDSTGTSLAVAEEDGTVVTERTLSGTYTLSYSDPTDAFRSASYSLELDGVEGPTFKIVPVRKDTTAVVTSLEVLLQTGNRSLAVGTPVPIITKAKGTSLQLLEPTVWLTGGVATLDELGRLVPTEPGAGTVEAEFLGVRASVPFTVAP